VRLFRPANIRTRLAVWYVVILAAILTVYIGAVFVFQYVLLERQIFHDEIQDVETVEGLLYFDTGGVLRLQEGYHSHPQSHLLEDVRNGALSQRYAEGHDAGRCVVSR